MAKIEASDPDSERAGAKKKEESQDLSKDIEGKKTTAESPEETDLKLKHEVTLSKTTGILLSIAIGAHAFFEGIAFGLQTEIESAGQLAAGIFIHKLAAAISIGAAFSRTGYKPGAIAIFLGLFSITMPIGIIIGILVTDANKLVDVIFMSLSGGTFLYVACSEIIVHEFAKEHRQWLKTLMVLLGGSVITALWFIGGHSHGDEGHDDHDDHSGHDDHLM